MFLGERSGRYHPDEISDFRKRVKESELLSPTPEQLEFRRKIFAEVDIASVESGVLPRLHEMTERLSGEPHKLVIFDAVELSVGSPFPTPTRYVLPIREVDLRTYADYTTTDEEIDEEIKSGKLKMPDFMLGLVIRRWPAGQTIIQVGLDMRADIHKIHPRLSTLAHHWKDGNTFAPPHWWPYEIPAEDITQEYDLMLPMNSKVALIYADDMDLGLGYFTAGGRDYKSKVGQITYSVNPHRKKPEEASIVWDQADNQAELNEAFEYLATYFADDDATETSSPTLGNRE